MNTLPAILIGGPPHSGKSVLTYSLSQALREHKVPHYILRAAPDGEGDWFNEAAPEVARTLRYKHTFTSEFVDHVCEVLQGRLLPLLVDVGGRPTPDQERIFDFCTHAILLTRDEESHITWTQLVQRHGLPLIADLTSRLEGESVLADTGPVLRGVLTGLHRHTCAQGPVFDALVARVQSIFTYEDEELRRLHYHAAPLQPVLDLDRLLARVRACASHWEPSDLPAALARVPRGRAQALYGRAPNWVYAAFAVHALPAPCSQFDARYGWLQPPPLQYASPTPCVSAPPLRFCMSPGADVSVLSVSLSRAYIEPSDLHGIAVPILPRQDQGLIVEGKIPHWLIVALARVYAPHAAWLAIYQPQQGGAVVVSAASVNIDVGNVYPWEPATQEHSR